MLEIAEPADRVLLLLLHVVVLILGSCVANRNVTIDRAYIWLVCILELDHLLSNILLLMCEALASEPSRVILVRCAIVFIATCLIG